MSLTLLRRLASLRRAPKSRATCRPTLEALETRCLLSFLGPVAYPTGNTPIDLAVGDFNGDGIPDLAVANRDSNTLSVLLGNGNGTFQSAHNTTVNQPQAIALGDFNHDGKLDAALYVLGPNRQSVVTVLPGKGDGSFGTPVDYPTGGNGVNDTNLLVGDFTGHGNLDLATVNANLNQLVVLPGRRDGTFGSALITRTNDLPVGFMTAADFNGDGKLDVAAAGGQSVLVFLGNGDGTFGTPSVVTDPNHGSPQQVAAADLNSDGKPDLVVADTGAGGSIPNGGVEVFLGNGDGTFQSPGRLFPAGTHPFSVAVADFTGDGKLDVAVADEGNTFEGGPDPGGIVLLPGNGDGTFQAPQTVAVGGASVFDQTVTADLNGDQAPDLAATYFPVGGGSGGVSVLLNAQTVVTDTWTGLSSNLWSDPGNWTAGVPVNGEDIVFPTGAANLTNTDNLTGLSLRHLEMTGSGYTLNEMTGAAPLELTGGLSNSAATGTNVIALELTGTGGVVVSAGDLKLTGPRPNTYTGSTEVTAGTLELDGAGGGNGPGGATGGAGGGTVPGNLVIGAPTGGAGGGNSPANVILEAPNQFGAATSLTFTGDSHLNLDGFTANVNDLAWRNKWMDASGDVAFNGTLDLKGDVSLPPDATAMPLQLGANLVLSPGTHTFDVAPGPNNLSLDGTISGDGGLTLTGGGQLTFAGSGANTYAGVTTVDAGNLVLDQSGGNAVPGPLVIGVGGSDVLATVQDSAPGQLTDDPVTFTGNGHLDLGGFTETVDALAWSHKWMDGSGDVAFNGTLDLNGDVNVTPDSARDPVVIGADVVLDARTFDVIDLPGFELKITGVVSGPANFGLVKTGAGVLHLTANNTYQGDTTVVAGTLLVDGSQPQSNVTVQGGATLGGGGTVGAVTAAPGATLTGDLHAGAVAFQPNSVFAEQLDGTGAGQLDQLIAAGSVDLSGATLQLTSAGGFARGQSFVIVQAGSPLTTTFQGLSEGGLVTVGGQNFQISYLNDQVTLTVVAGASPLSGTGLPVSGFEFSALPNVVVAAFTASGGGPFTTQVAWGDGALSAGTVVPSGGGYVVEGSHTYTDEGSHAVVVIVTGGGGEATFTTTAALQEEVLPDGTRGTANQRFISEVYRDLLGRPVEAVGLAGWEGLLDQSGSRFQVVLGIEQSPEYAGVVVDRLYAHYLHRAAEPAGRAAWLTFLLGGGTATEMAALVAVSPEYGQTRGGGAVAGWLTVLYEDVLGRSPDPAGQAGWSAALGAGLSPFQVAWGVLTSPEGRTVQVAGSYERLLDRPPDAQGSSGWTKVLLQGLPDEVLLAAILGDAAGEFYNKTAS